MSHIVNLINIMNQLANNNNVLNRSFNDQGGSSKPCSASFVDSLEKVVVTNEDVDKGLCCAICQEEFKMGERVIRLPCKDPHYFHCETPEDICGGILPWLKNNNSCPVCREEFPEEEEEDSGNAIPVPDENFDNPQEDNDEDNDDNEEVDDRINQQMEEIIQRLFTIPPINTPPLQNPQLPPINLRNTIYIPMIIPMNNYSEDEDPDLQEAIRQSLGS